MSRRLVLSTLAAVVATGLAALSAGPALANTTISINPGNIEPGGTLAASTGQDCALGGGPYADKDVWVFNLPGNSGSAGVFVSVSAVFDTGGTHVTKSIPADGGGISAGPGTSKAYIATPAGWRLLGATAVISGTADFFTLTHTCKAGSSTSPSPSPSPSKSPTSSPSSSSSSSPSSSPSAGDSGTPTPGSSPSESPGGGSSSSTGSSSPSGSGGLPVTGVALTAFAGLGTLLIAAGVFTLLAARRRRSLLDG